MIDVEPSRTLTLPDLLRRSVERWGDRLCLLAPGQDPGSSRTYAELAAEVDRLAGAFAELGVRRGSRVAVLLPSDPTLLRSWLALARLGAAMVPIHPDLTPGEAMALIERSRAQGLITDLAHAEVLERLLQLPLRVVAGPGGFDGALPFDSLLAGPPCHAEGPDPRDVASLLFTSGTTGVPKGARMTHNSFVLPAVAFGRFMEVTPEDRLLGCLPLYHLAGESFAMAALANGASLAVVERFRGSELWRQVAEHRATLMRYIGEMLAVLCRHPEQPGERQHSLRAVYGGGARPEVAETFTRRFGIPVVEGYGLTETNTVLANGLASRRAGSIGRPLGYCRVRIADGEGRELAAGEVGEIQVERNLVMMDGYEGDDDLTRNVFQGEWFRTGDLGHFDEAGNCYFVGRTKDVIRRRGENVPAPEVEAVLGRHPAVALAAVVGVPDDFGGEEIKAYIVLRSGSGASARELHEWCAQSLAPFKVPRWLELCPELPMTATHKVQKGELRTRGPHSGVCFDCTEPLDHRAWRTECRR